MFLLWRESVLNSLDLPETFKTVLGELLEILNRDVVGFNGDIHTVPREKLKSFIAHLTEIEYGTRFILQCGITSSLFLKETIDSGFYESFCNDVLQLLDDDLQQNSINSTDSEQKGEFWGVFFNVDERVAKLVMVATIWAQSRGLVGAEASVISECAWRVMVVFFLQNCNPPVLPAFDAAGNTHTAACIRNNRSLAELLFQFFAFYGTVPSEGEGGDKQPDARSGGFNFLLSVISIMKTSHGSAMALREGCPSWRMCVQDPIQHTRDLACTISSHEDQELLLNELHRAYTILCSHLLVLDAPSPTTVSASTSRKNLRCWEELCKPGQQQPALLTYREAADSVPTLVQEWNDEEFSPFSEVFGGAGLQERVLSWKVHDIRNPDLLQELDGPIPEVFLDASMWFGAFPSFVAEELRAQLEQAVTRKLGDAACCFGIELEAARYAGMEIMLAPLLWIPHAGFKNREACEDKCSYAYALLVKSASASLTQQQLQDAPHVLLSIGRVEDKLANKRPEMSPFTVTVLRSPLIAPFLAGGEAAVPCSGWQLVVLDVQSIAPQRICDALAAGDSPPFMEDIISATYRQLPVLDDSLAHSAVEFPPDCTLNPAQKKAVEKVWRACDDCCDAPRIQLIKGPPGTGKTSTLVQLLRALVSRSLIVHATAPTNTAVCELARRFVSSAAVVCNSWAHSQANPCQEEDGEECLEADRGDILPLCLADVVLVGTVSRLKFSGEDDILRRAVLDARATRIAQATLQLRILRTKLSGFVALHEGTLVEAFTPPSTDQQRQEEQVQVVLSIDYLNGLLAMAVQKHFQELIASLKTALNTLICEAPAVILKSGLHKQARLKLERLLTAAAQHTGAQLKQWMLCTFSSQQDTVLPLLDAVAALHSNLNLLVRGLREVEVSVLPLYELKNEIVQAARVVFSTVNVGGRAVFRRLSNDVVVIDEASQLVQAETAIVLHRNLKCAVLVGDEQQLPSTVISQKAKHLGYGKSLFDRLIQHRYPYSLLDTQYRMHPHISRWPRILFYNGEVVDGENVRSQAYVKPWHSEFPPFQLCNVRGGREQTSESGSKFNQLEVIVVRQMLNALRGHLKAASGAPADSPWSVGLVSPYAAQVEELSKLCSDGCKDSLMIRASTVDGFQGQECDFIIFSAVRSNSTSKIGFLEDKRRLNVAITRARYGLVIICDTVTVSSNATWRVLVEHARDTNAFMDSSNTGETTTSTLLSKAVKLWEKQECCNRAILEPSSSIFEHCPWKIVFSGDFKTDLAKSDPTKRQAIVEAMLKLAEGKWPKFMLTDKPVSSLFLQSIFTLAIQGRRSAALLWSVDVLRDTHSAHQYIKLWNIVNTATAQLVSAVQRVENGMRQYSAQYRDFCIPPQKRDSNKGAFLPLKWEAEALNGVQWFLTSAKRDSNSGGDTEQVGGGAEQSDVKEAVHLAKFYPLTSDVARFLSTASNVANIELPFAMSKEEEAIVRHDGSVVVLGRSGTGKTTVILHRMFAVSEVFKQEQRLLKNNAEDSLHCRQLLLTASPVLCKAIKRAFDTMTSTATALSASATNLSCAAANNSSGSAPGGAADALVFDDDIEDVHMSAMALQSIPSAAFPLITTYAAFLRLLDRTLSQPFFASSATSSRLVNRKEVDFDHFQHFYYPAFSDKLRKAVGASALYMEIFTHIKGSLGALGGSRLSLERYLALGGSRSVTGGAMGSTDMRRLVYQAFLRYEAKKEEQRDYDVLDVVHHAYQQLARSPYEGPRMHAVYVDEVQDLTPAQIALLKFVTASPKSYLFAGDTAQTIAHGVGFRFETVKDIFYYEFLGRGTAAAAGSGDQDKEMPAMWQLCRNFRTHSGVVNLANNVVQLVLRFFPHSIDRMDPEYSQVSGPRPIIVESKEDIVTELFQSKTGGGALEFGAEQVILVRDEETKRQLTAIAGRNALVLTVLEAKGMEFTDCLIYNFFKSSPLTQEWRVLYSADDSWDKARTEFDPSRHGALCTELKLLYVLLTRARQHLLLFDEDKASREPMLHLWRKAGLVEQKPLDEDLKSLFRSDSTPEEWKGRGEQFFERKQFANARFSFQRARHDFGERLCDAAEQEQNAERCSEVKLAVSMFAKAAVMYVELGRSRWSSAARCYERAGDFASAASYYRELRRYSEAACCFASAKRWADAAQMHSQAGELQPCLARCYEGHLYDLALTLLRDWASTAEDAVVLSEHQAECIKTAAMHYHTADKEEDMMRFVKLFPSTDEKRRFLRRYEHLPRLLETELADDCFLEAAHIYESMFDFQSAADCYERTGFPAEALGCALKYVRRASLRGDDYLPEALAKTHAAVLQARVDSVNLHVTITADQCNAVARLLLEAEMLQQLPDCQDPAVLRALFQQAQALPRDAAGGVVAFSAESSWRLRLQSARLGFTLALERVDLKEGAYYCAELTAVVQEALSILTVLCAGRFLSQADAKTLFSCMTLFEFSWDLPVGGRIVVPRTLKAPYASPGLQSVFGLPPVQSCKPVVASISLLEFSQRALKFCQALVDNAGAALDAALLGSQDQLLQKATSTANMSVQQFVATLKGGQAKAPPAYSSTAKLALLESLCEQLALMRQDDGATSALKGGAKGKPAGNHRVLLLAVEVAAPHVPSLEEMGAVVRARKNVAVQALVSTFHAATFQQPGLQFQRIAQSLLLAVLAGCTTHVTARLTEVLCSEFKRVKVSKKDAAVDTRSLLVGAFHWEHALESDVSMPHGTLLYGACSGLSAVIYDAGFGAVNKVAFGASVLPASVKEAHGCYSPMVMIKLLERYFVLFLLHFRQFSDVVMPSKLAQDVLCVKHDAFCSVLSSYRARTGPAALTNEQRKERESLARTYLEEIKTLLLNIMFQLRESGWKKWQLAVANIEPTALQQSTPHFFWQRLVVMLATLIGNLARGNRLRATICRNLKDYGKRTPSLMPAEVLQLVQSLGSDKNEPNEVLASFCTRADDPLLLLHCDPHCSALPGYAKKLRLQRRVLIEGADAAGFVELVEQEQAQLRVAAAGPTDEAEEEQEEAPVHDEDEEQGQSMFAAGVVLEAVLTVPAPVEEESEQALLERKLGSLCVVLRRRAEEARERLRSMGPKGALVRLLEKECKDANIPRTAAVVVQYAARLLPMLLELEHHSAHVEEFVLTKVSGQQGAATLQRRDRALDLQGTLEEAIALLTPRDTELLRVHSAARDEELETFLLELEEKGRQALQQAEKWKKTA